MEIRLFHHFRRQSRKHDSGDIAGQGSQPNQKGLQRAGQAGRQQKNQIRGLRGAEGAAADCQGVHSEKASGERHDMMNGNFFSFMEIHDCISTPVCLVVFLVAGGFRVDGPLSGHGVALQVLVVGGDLIDHGAVGQKLDDAVRRGLHDLVVTGGEQKHARELDQSVVQGGDGLHVQVVRGLVEDQDVRAGNHQLGKHAAHLLASGKHLDLLHAVLAGEEHTAQEAAHVGGVLDLGILGQPVHDGVVVVEFPGVVLGEIGLAGGHAPLVGALVRLHLAGQDLEQGGLRELVAAHEGDLVVVSQDEGDVVQHLHAVDGLGDALYGQHLVADLAVRTEIDVRIFAAGGTQLLQLDFFQGLFPGGRLAGLGSVGGETGDEFLQLLDLLLLLLVGLLHLPDHQLAGLVPEIIVSGVELNLAIVDVRDLGTDLIQEIAVVGDHNDGVREIDQELLQPGDGVQIQVVRGLVEQQDVGISKQEHAI